MKIGINGYRGITEAIISLEKIAAVFGPNGAGKSSIAGAVKTLLSSNPMASSGINKRDAMKLVNDQVREATANLSTANGSIGIEWPSCEVDTVGKPPRSSDVALGIVDVLTMDKKTRDQFLGELLNSEPTQDDLSAAIEHLMDSDKMSRLLTDLEANGWDTMAKHYAELATQKKGAWKQITGQNWGSAKASNYVPDHWSPDLDRASLAQLQAAVVEATATVEGIAASNAIDDAELDQLTAAAKKIPDLESAEKHAMDDLELCREKIAEIKSELITSGIPAAEQLVQQIESLPEMEKRAIDLEANISEGHTRLKKMEFRGTEIVELLNLSAPMGCPKCGAHLVIESGGLSLVDKPISSDEITELRAEQKQNRESVSKAQSWIAKKSSELADLKLEIEQINKIGKFDFESEVGRHMLITEVTSSGDDTAEELGGIRQRLTDARQAAKQLESVTSAPHGTDGDINSARELQRVAQADLTAWKTKDDADQVSATVNHYLEMSKILGPGGLRKQTLGGALQTVNADIASWSPWPIKIKNDLSVTYDGRPITLCCESERWRASTVVQILVALRNDDPVIVIDRADILDNTQKNRLFKMLVSMPFSTLAMLKADNRSDVLDLSKKGVGVSYWVDGGACSAV